MAAINEIQNELNQESVRALFRKLYANDEAIVQQQIRRYANLTDRIPDLFSSADDIRFISTPGRTELGGNHTDHNNGCVLAAAVNIDAVAAVAKTDDMQAVLYSDAFAEPFIVDLQNLEFHREEKGTTHALIRGIAAILRMHGYEIGGFKAVMSSDVALGCGLSSSAVIELIVATILNRLYNHGILSRMQMASFGRFAENNYFGKPCGLMDQIACAFGGIVAIDFKKPANPEVKRVRTTFPPEQTSMLIVDTGEDHADLTGHYAAVPAEMFAVAQFFNKESGRELDWQSLQKYLPDLREKTGDRAVLRMLHFLQENERVSKQTQALECGEFATFFKLVNDSGDSSWRQLQNVSAGENPQKQSLALGLALTAQFLQNMANSACRVHGGGFAGTMQVFLPREHVSDYK